MVKKLISICYIYRIIGRLLNHSKKRLRMKVTEANLQVSPTEIQPTEIDFDNIAISLSGGGYRAAAFHLGTLDLLQQVGLLDKLTMLSTVSGGTITGAKYVLSLSQKDPNTTQDQFFQHFYDEIYKFLLNEPLPNTWIQKLNRQNHDSQETPSLIVAAAETYRKLFGNTQFKDIIQVKSTLHLKEIIFNTTELRTGIDFRFQIGTGKIGNGKINIPESVLEEVYIADVVAASSCFPVGFEPMYFPDDFFLNDSWEKILNKINNQRQRDSLRNKFSKSLPLMDGGIYDNLGVDALWLANERNKKRAEKENDPSKKTDILRGTIGTLIISDTDNLGLEETLLKKPDSNLPIPTWITKITLRQVKSIVQVFFYIFLISTILYIAYLVYLIGWSGSITLGKIVSIILIALAAGIFGGLQYIFKKLSNFFKKLSSPSDIFKPTQEENSEEGKNILAFLREIISDWDNFMQTIGNFTIAEAYNLLIVRLQSLPAVLLAFLKGQRRRNYDTSYDHYERSVIANYIFDAKRESRNTSPEMADIAFKATKTPTTLWFDQDPEQAQEQLNDLIACGQFTMCYKLRKYIEDISTEENINLSPEMNRIKQEVNDVWKQLQENPHVLVRVLSEPKDN